jgi:hypothetical protein
LGLDHRHFARLGAKAKPLLARVSGGELGAFGS